jgi:hypothetical protein
MSIVWSETGEQYKGAVLMTRERNFLDDSDFYAVVWNAEKQALDTVEYDSTRYGGGGSAKEDATPEVVEAANLYAYKSLKKVCFDAYKEKLALPVKGDTVKVVKGRTGKGSVGKLFWVGEERTYGSGYSSWATTKATKVGVALDDEKDEKGRFKNAVWTYLHNVEVADVSKKFKYSEAKRALKSLKRAGWAAWSAYQAYPLAYFH